jgi:nucleoside-diphosphate-sugar epimerase
MTRNLFLVGATGAIGRRLTPMLLADGWSVTGMTRSAERAKNLQDVGVHPVVADAFDVAAVKAAVLAVAPSVMILQLTDLPREADLIDDAALARNAHLNDIGTSNLVQAAELAGVQRLVVQSLGFSYAPGPMPYTEEFALEGTLPDASPMGRGIKKMEDHVIGSGMSWVILRYGRLYGPGTGAEEPWGPAPVHVDAAAKAAALAARDTVTGIFNIAEEDGEVDSAKARSALGWSPAYRHT